MASSSPSSSVFDVREHTIQASHIREYPRATAVSQDEPFLLHVKQYSPKNGGPPRKGDITIVGAHANGFPKELYEPLYEEFLKELEKQGLRLRAIWIADTAHQGQSGVLNVANLGNDPNWLDYSRDILHLINTFRMPRPIIAMGHSFGANALTNVALMHPRLFTGMVMLDPVIARFTSPSRSPARHKRTMGPRPSVLRAATPGLRALPPPPRSALSPSIRPGIHECLISSSAMACARSHLPPILSRTNPKPLPSPQYPPPVLYIFGAKSNVSPAHLIREKLEKTGTGVGGSGGAKAGRVKGVTHPESGHLVPLEEPVFCAKAAAEWTKTEMDKWWEEEKEYEEWTKKPLEEKATVDDEFMKRLGAPNRKSDKTKANL
ncbi:hypothetical protein TrVFT333_004360 [Trichoderma virens FT-333]|nr:hypothetical protein TrVFT333_004360 [Trichoderma virens FT-333]